MLDGNAEDLDQECEAYEAKIKDAGGIELFVAGSAHILYPTDPLPTVTSPCVGTATDVTSCFRQIIKPMG